LLSSKYLSGIPADARINRPGGGSFSAEHLNEKNLEHVRALNTVAQSRGQSLAQMAVAWVLRDKRVSSALIGASKPAQIIELAETLKQLDFTPQELAAARMAPLEASFNLAKFGHAARPAQAVSTVWPSPTTSPWKGAGSVAGRRPADAHRRSKTALF
jgi:L-glyceraldehyde 3-phosphate reductase